MCHKLQSFWTSVFVFFSQLLKIKLEPDPVWIIIGLSEQSKKLNVIQTHLMSYGLMSAKKLILLLWKGKEVPSLKAWISVMTDTLRLERIRYYVDDRLNDFEQIWKPFTTFLETMVQRPNLTDG